MSDDINDILNRNKYSSRVCVSILRNVVLYITDLNSLTRT